MSDRRYQSSKASDFCSASPSPFGIHGQERHFSHRNSSEDVRNDQEYPSSIDLENGEQEYEFIGFPGGTLNHCPRRMFLCDALDVSAVGEFVRLIGMIVSINGSQRTSDHRERVSSITLDDGTGAIEVFMMDPCCYSGDVGLIKSIGDGGSSWNRETVFPPPSQGQVSTKLQGKRNRAAAKKAKVQQSVEKGPALGLCVDCIGRLVHSSETKGKEGSKQASCFSLLADSVSVVHDPNALALRQLEIMSEARETPLVPSNEKIADATGIFMPGSLVCRLGTFYCSREKEQDDENMASSSSWKTPSRHVEGNEEPLPGLRIRKSHVLRIITSCSNNGDGAAGVSEADLLLLLGCMDDGCPEEWAGVLREALEELKEEGEVYVSRQGNFLPL